MKNNLVERISEGHVTSSSSAKSSALLDRRIVPVLALILALVSLGHAHGTARLAVLALIGVAAGMALYHASFGFTAAWRRFILKRESAGLRAQFIMLGVAALIFFPALAAGSIFGRPVGGYVFPVGVALISGAFIFGIGMQLGNGCGSGTLFTIGGGSVRMLVTLAFFILGSTLAAATAETWRAWPSLPPVSIIEHWGAIPALFYLLAMLTALYHAVRHAEKAKHGTLASLTAPQTRWLSGPWSLLAGALALAAINIATLIVSGWPWGITGAFALWGSKIAGVIGFAPQSWAFWQGQEDVLHGSVFTDVTSVMDFGIMAGALLAAVLAGKFKPGLNIPARSLIAAMIGGLLLGIGARLGTGCNIGAFFSGIVSGSLHGWVWLGAAFAGNLIGVKLRPFFRLD